MTASIKEGFNVNIQEQQVSVNFLTEAGATVTNKEYFTGVELADFACWVIAERLDSCVEKESARLAADQVITAFTAQPTVSRVKIREYLMQAQQKLLAESVGNQIKLRANLLMVVTDYRKIIYGVSGNVRLYHLRQGRFNFRSKDQTMAQVMLDAGNLDETEVNRRNERNSLINFLGITEVYKPLVASAYQLQDNDQLLLCNINFWENFTNEEIATVWSEASDPVANLKQLKTELLTRKPQTQHFIVAAIDFKQIRRRRWGSISGQDWPKLAVGLPLCCIILMGAMLLNNFSSSQKAPIMPLRQSQNAVHQKSQTNLRQPQPEELDIAPEEVVQVDLIQQTIAMTPSVQAPVGPERTGLRPAVSLAAGEAVASIDNYKVNVRQAPKRKAGETLKPEQYRKKVPEAVKPKVSTGSGQLKKTLPLDAKPNVTAGPEQSKVVTKISNSTEAVDPASQADASDLQLPNGAVVPPKNSVALEREQKALRAKTLEVTGDDLCRQEKYSEALEYYKQAYQIYQQLGMKEAAVLIDWKINRTIKEKLRAFLKQGLK
jgi:serine/threonine protein phosphatase PrpC